MIKVLIIDDEDFLRREMVEILRREGYDTRQAGDGRTGIELALRDPPDVVVCDIMLPGMDGFQILQTLRDNADTASIPFVFITGMVDTTDIRQGMDLGADDYLTKPFTGQELLNSLRQRLKRRARQVEEIQQASEVLGFRVAALLPREFSEPLRHVETVVRLMALEPGQACPQLDAMRNSVLLETEKLRRLVHRLYLYAQMPGLYANRFELRHADAAPEPAEVVAQEARAAARQWQREGDLRLDLAPGGIHIKEEYLTIITRELLDNAFQYSATPSPVRVASRKETGFLSLEITDEGSGMRPEEIHRVAAFTQFLTGPNQPRGLGLGLVLVQSLVRLHGGEFCLESDGRHGTRARVMMPAH